MAVWLPIDDVLPALKDALEAGTNAVVTAPPGAGKTTRVPLMLQQQPWLRDRRIIMLEPRRLAVRGAARQMANILGESVGATVGYRTRGDTKVSAATKIEVVTEGVLTRMLQSDPGLAQAAAVVFDEFHERSIHADLGLALCLQSQALFREDLRLVVMSATLHADAVCRILGDAPIISSEGRMFPVEMHYGASRSSESIEARTAKAVHEALQRHAEGDVLVFLPGGGEIRRTQAVLSKLPLPAHTNITPLYGGLSPEAQDKAIEPSRPGERKVVLSTSIAETSLTVEGIRIVIDAGLSRIPRFSPRNGLTRLDTVPVSVASADQRRGRAGRLGPGVCYRLWTEEEHRSLDAYGIPEILAADLAPLVLELAVWGVYDPTELSWLDAPPEGAFRQAVELLIRLGALDKEGTLTPEGKRMADIGMHPRLARMMLQAIPLGLGRLACELAVLLEERDMTGGGADIRDRLQALRRQESPHADRLRAEVKRRCSELGLDGSGAGDAAAAGKLLALAYPDRIGQRRPNGKYILSAGRGAELPTDELLSRESYLVAAELDGAGIDSRIRLAAPIAADDINRLYADQLTETEDIRWDRSAESVRARKRISFGAIVLEDAPLSKPDPQKVKEALMQGVAEEGLDMLPWTKAAIQWRQRVLFLRKFGYDEFPDASDEGLLRLSDSWLEPFIEGMKSKADLGRLRLLDALDTLLTWEQRQRLQAWAPTHLAVPSGSKIAVDYSDTEAPVLSVRLQEMFGWLDTPMLAGGRCPLTLHLLSPANRPVQVTRDLANFWRETYFEVKKDLRGRYPRHYWPDNPLEASATRGTRPNIRK